VITILLSIGFWNLRFFLKKNLWFSLTVNIKI